MEILAEAETLMTTALSQDLVKAVKADNLSLLSQIIQQEEDLNASSANGWTPLMLALLHNRLEATEMLLKSGADPNLATDSYENPKRLPLLVAVCNGRLAAVKLLIAYRADIAQRDASGRTALETAQDLVQRPSQYYEGYKEAMQSIVSVLSTAASQHSQNSTLMTSAG